MATSLRDLISDQDDQIKDELEALLDSQDPSDMLAEMVDGNVPIMNGDLAECLEADNSLASVEDSGLLPKNPDVWKIISVAIYEQLSNAAHSTFEELKTEYEEFVSECESEGYGIEYIKPEKTYTIVKANPDYDEDEEDSEEYETIQGDFSSEFEAWKWLEEHGANL